MRLNCIHILTLSLVLASCSKEPSAGAATKAAEVAPSSPISPANLLVHIRELASDRYEGRAPGSQGEELATAYIEQQFRKFGLAPGNPDGTYVQSVPLLGFQSTPDLKIQAGTRELHWRFLEDYVAVSRWAQSDVRVDDSEMIFVGYGIDAPEQGWDDYKGVDVRGKTLVMLINDPPVPDPKDPTKLDPNVFGGKAMTYYGRWTYKYEIGAKKGAAAVLIVHETEPAAYPFEVVRNSWGRENFDLESADGNKSCAAIEGWMQFERAKELFSACGQDFAELKHKAAQRDFRPVPLAAHATVSLQNKLRPVASRNVVAKIVGTDPKLRDETIVLTAHWDHLGKDDTIVGDGIYNGAMDNASGVAGLLALAETFAHSEPKLARTLVFVSVTAEERGLLGARWYCEHPLYPLAKTLCNLNIDGLNVLGRTSDVVSIGKGMSSLDELLEPLALQQRRSVHPDPTPEKGTFYRSDHFEFSKAGVPAMYLGGGVELIGKPVGEGQKRHDEFTAKHYHKPSDEVRDDWDLSGACEDLNLLRQMALEVAGAKMWPEWKATSEFRAHRVEQLKLAQPR